MRFPPEPKTSYVLDKPQYKRIFDKLSKFVAKKLSKKDEEVVRFLYSQLEENWEDPLEKFIDKMLK
ncbi:MAG: hypothetical protein Q8Q48_04415 [Candidatus Staskawiczbacteria bacterium]|nr:hypothetical protein [Candidatus Staskawiczbacteria bacterium]